jgi:hypothetical protein
MGLDTLEIINDTEDLNPCSGIDHIVDKETGTVITRRVVARSLAAYLSLLSPSLSLPPRSPLGALRYVCQRTPVPLNRTVPPCAATVVHPAVPPPVKEFPLSVNADPTPTPTYEMTIIRRLDPPLGATETADKYYKVHMTINEEDYRHLILTQRDASKREVHQRRYYFINGRQPVIVIQNEDPWLLDMCQRSASLSPSSTRLTPAWVKVCTEGSQLNPLPSFLNVGETIKSNSMEYTISIAAATAAIAAAVTEKEGEGA